MENKQTRTKRNSLVQPWIWMFLGVIGTIFMFVLPSSVEASIYNTPRLSIASDGATIDSKYTFFPEFSSDTKVSTWGPGWSTKNYSNGDSTRKFVSNDVSQPSQDYRKNKIGVTYSHVGQYEGQDIDLKIHIHNWDPYGNQWRETRWDGVIRAKVGNIGFQTDKIAVSTQGFKYVDMTWQFVKSGTSTPVNVSGYFTFSDIDISQGIQFSKQTSTDIDRFMVHNRSNKLMYSNKSGEYKIYDTRDVDVNDYAYLSDYAFTFLYSDSPSFRFKWTTDWASSLRWGTKPETWTFMYNDVHKNAGGEYLFHVKNKPVATTVSPPTKSVSTTGNIKTTDTLKYTIKDVIPTEPSEFYYTSYSITDSFNTALKNVGLVSITDQKGINRTNWFTVNKSSNTIIATANSGTLKNAAFYGNVFTLNMSAKLDSATTLSKLGSNATYGIKNYVNLKVNGKTYKSNTVTTTISKRILTIKHVDKDTNTVLKTETKAVLEGDSYSIPTISTFKTPQNHNYKPVTAGNVTGTITGNKTITIPYEKPRKMTINYINDDTGNNIRSFDTWASTYKSEPTVSEVNVGLRYDRTAFSFTAMNQFSLSNVNYKFVKFDATSKPAPTAPTSTTLSSSAAGDAVLNVRYTPGRVFTVKHVDKDDKKVLKTDTTNTFDGEKYSITPSTTFKTSDGLNYRPVSSAVVTGTIKGNMTITIEYEKPRKITFNHVDKDDNKLLGTESTHLYDGATYSKTPITTFKTADGLLYRPIVKEAVTGIVKGDMTITIKYEKPRTITLQHKDDDDNRVLATEKVNHYDGESFTFKARNDLKDPTGDLYKALASSVTGTTNGNMTVEIRYTKKRIITIQHKDDDDNRVIATDKIKYYDGDKFTFNARTDLKDLTDDNYKPKSANVSGTTKGNMTVEIRYIKRRLLTVEHIDKDTNKIIATSTNKADKKYDGERWTFNVRTDLKYKQDNVDYIYYPLAPESQTAITAGDLTGSKAIKFYYTKPSAEISVKHVQIKTDKKANGLPLVLTIDTKILAENRWEDNSLRVKVTDKTGTVKLLTTQTKSLKEVAKDGFKWVIPASELAINAKNNYEVVIETIDAKKLVVNTAKAKIDTDGYTSSESVIDVTNNQAAGAVKDKAGNVIQGVTITEIDKQKTLAFKGISMTERTIGQEMKLRYETTQTTLNEDIVTPSGYGMELNQPISFSTDINDDALPAFTAKIVADNVISDGDYNALTSTQHELITTQKTTDKDKLNRTIEFNFPKVTIDKGLDGIVYTKGTPDGKSAYDGGSKMYVNVWPKKEDVDGKVHNFTVKTSAIGRHQVTFNITQRVTIESYMMGHLDSDTLKNDSLLVQPTKKADDLFKDRP